MTPVMKNARTMFKVMNEFKKTDAPKPTTTKTTTQAQTNTQVNEPVTNDSGPTFFA